MDEFFYQDILQYYPKVEKVRDLSLVKEDMIKIVANFPEEDLDEANRWLNDIFEGVTAVATGFDSVDIILSDIHKAVGLSHLCMKKICFRPGSGSWLAGSISSSPSA